MNFKVHKNARIDRLGEIDLDSVQDKLSELRLSVVNNRSKRGVIRFQSHCCYLVRDEGDAIKFLTDFKKEKLAGFYIYESTTSEFYKWFFDQSHSTRSTDGVKHYLVLTMNYIIDVIGYEDPDYIAE